MFWLAEQRGLEDNCGRYLPEFLVRPGSDGIMSCADVSVITIYRWVCQAIP